ncbi:hypothetical protein HY991_02325 [Candidatus Micrarchaeota archaeon]|nr:hypothetical protein [Candidatus Micrarchaeota archaeon]
MRWKYGKRNSGRKGFWSDETGQVSAELIIVIAALIAVALVLITQLQNTAKTGKKILANETSKAWDEIRDIK